MSQCGRGPGKIQLDHYAAAPGRKPRAEPSVVDQTNFTFGQPRPVVSATQVRHSEYSAACPAGFHRLILD